MKNKDFKDMMQKIKAFCDGKKLVAYKYASNYMVVSDGVKEAQGLNITMHFGSTKVNYYKLYDLQPNKHGGYSYQDSRDVSNNYYDLTSKQADTLNAYFEALHYEQY